MRAGDLRHRITIQKPPVTETRDSTGGVDESWETFATVWASKAHMTSREFFAAQKSNAETTDLFIIRYRDSITTKMRVLFGSRTYDIIGANDPDGRRRELHLLCKEVV